MPYKYDRRTREFLGTFLLVVSHDFDGLLIKQLIHSRLLDTRWYSQHGATRLVGYLSSHIQRALVE